MATNGVPARASNVSSHRYSRLLSGIAIRLIIALMLSFIILAFFVTAVASH